MRSRAESRPAFSLRLALELACRIGAVAAVTAAAVLLWRGTPSGDESARAVYEVASDEALDSLVLTHLVIAGSGQRAERDDLVASALSLSLRHIPDTTRRARLGGLPRAGVPVRWRLSDSAASDAMLAATVTRVAGPDGDFVVRTTRHAGALVLRDAGGLLDSLTGSAEAQAMTWHLRSVTWPLTVRGSHSSMALARPDSSRARMVRVLGAPGWEYKFTVAALEELGWRVDGAVRVSPSAQVSLGSASTPLDTARHAAVVITDSAAVDAASLQRFVEAGGGLVLLGDALRIPALASLRPAVATERRGAIAGALLTDTPLAGLEAWELRPAADALVLESLAGDANGGHGHDEPVLVARRRGAGRVLAVAYREMWRWRMEGPDAGMDDHRAWWRGILAAVGATTAPPLAPDTHPGPGAPYADLVSWVGAPQGPSGQEPPHLARSPGAIGPRNAVKLAPWLAALALALLCIEWGSRRLRGVR